MEFEVQLELLVSVLIVVVWWRHAIRVTHGPGLNSDGLTAWPGTFLSARLFPGPGACQWARARGHCASHATLWPEKSKNLGGGGGSPCFS